MSSELDELTNVSPLVYTYRSRAVVLLICCAFITMLAANDIGLVCGPIAGENTTVAMISNGASDFGHHVMGIIHNVANAVK
jgi:hypothetical protein